MRRPLRVTVMLATLAVSGCREEPATRTAATVPRRNKPGVSITMDALHLAGGIPPNWEFSPPLGDREAGRRAFVDFGCSSCHRVAGEPFTAPDGGPTLGPELTNMGAHHPPSYFAESIVNPDAVLVNGPGYIGPDGHSTMPEYPDMTIQQVGDLVAYLSSLTTWAVVAADHSHTATAPRPFPPARPAPAPEPAKAFLLQSYDVKPGQLDAFVSWFANGGAKRLRGIDGLLGIDTFVDFTRDGNPYTTVFAFRDELAAQRFLDDPLAQALGREFDGYLGEHTRSDVATRPLYRVPVLSSP